MILVDIVHGFDICINFVFCWLTVYCKKSSYIYTCCLLCLYVMHSFYASVYTVFAIFTDVDILKMSPSCSCSNHK